MKIPNGSLVYARDLGRGEPEAVVRAFGAEELAEDDTRRHPGAVRACLFARLVGLAKLELPELSCVERGMSDDVGEERECPAELVSRDREGEATRVSVHVHGERPAE